MSPWGRFYLSHVDITREGLIYRSHTAFLFRLWAWGDRYLGDRYLPNHECFNIQDMSFV